MADKDENSGGGAPATTTVAVGLSQDEVQEQIRLAIEADRQARDDENERLKLQLSQVAAEANERRVNERVRAWEDANLPPAAIKEAQKFLLADQERPAAINLSQEDGETISLSVSDVVESMMKVMPGVSEAPSVKLSHDAPDLDTQNPSADEKADVEWKKLHPDS